MHLIEVTNKKTAGIFHQTAREIYKNDSVWVCPLDNEVEARFDPKQNVGFKKGNAVRWVLVEGKTLIGRIAAFYDKSRVYEHDQPTGGIGFFECINSLEAAQLLFNVAQHWLKDEGMEAMDGPINFGENDNNWGLLVKGFTHPGYGMPYHHSYYKNLFEEYGFQKYFEQYSYHLDLTQPFPNRFWKIAEWVAHKPGYSFRHFKISEKKVFINDFSSVYNEAWSNFKKDFTPLNPDDVERTFTKAKGILDEELIWFAYYKNHPIAFFIMMPDVNQILKYFNGKLNLFNMIRFLYMKKFHKINRIRAMVAGVVPSHQNSGIESAIFKQFDKVMEHKPWYKEVELSWVGDFNPKMRKLYEATGATLAKTHITYRYIFDRKVPFKRFMAEVFDKKVYEFND